MPSGGSIFHGLPAPAPRYLMRLALLEELIERVPAVSRFLEVGPGMGDVSLYLSRRFPRARGELMDFSPQCTDILRERTQGHDSLSVTDGDFQLLSNNNAYDLIVACEVFEHLEADEPALAAIQRLLRPGGRFLFSVPAFMRKWQNADVFAGHYRRYERDELERKFARAGLEIEELWCYGFPVTALTYPLRQFYYRQRTQGESLTKKQATQRSGVDRTLVQRLRWLPLATLLKPFFLCQKIVRRMNIGDGFLVLARKPSSDRTADHAH
jgi:SAM-dependent methyltransferase